MLCLPEVFDQREDDGVMVLLRAEPDPDPDQEAAVLEAVGLIPAPFDRPGFDANY